MSKYIIKNCPACCEYTQTYCCEDNYDKQGRDTYCELIDDCIMKKIVDLCRSKDYFVARVPNTQFSSGVQNSELAYEILELLDIQEAE